MLHNLFPIRDAHLQDASQILSKIVTEEQIKKKRFSTGKSFTLVVNDSNSF